MTASVFSTLTGKLVGKHPALGVLVREDGKVLCLKKGYRYDNPNAKFHWTVGVLNSNGYRRIRFKKKYYSVHRLVAETFIPNPLGLPTTDHINRNRSDNRLCNLRWADMQEQSRNRKSYDAALDLGVRKHDDPEEWNRRYARRWRDIKRQDPEWVEKERTKRREYQREYRQNPECVERRREYERKRYQNPEFRKKKAEYHREYLRKLTPEQKERMKAQDIEKHRKYRERKKAEQSARSSV